MRRTIALQNEEFVHHAIQLVQSDLEQIKLPTEQHRIPRFNIANVLDLPGLPSMQPTQFSRHS